MKHDLAVGIKSQPAEAKKKSGMFFKILYLTRVITYLMAMIPGLVLVLQENIPDRFYYIVYIIIVGLIMPHIEELIRQKTTFYKKFDEYLFVFSAFWSATLTGMLHYSVYIFIGVVLLSFLGPVIVAGFRYIYKFVIAISIGLLVGGFLNDFEFQQSVSLSVQLVCVGNLLLYSTVLAFGMHLNSNYLKKTRDVLSETTNINNVFNAIFRVSSSTLSTYIIMSSLLAAFSRRYFEAITFLVFNQEENCLKTSFFEGLYTAESLANLMNKIEIPIGNHSNKDSYIITAFNQNKTMYLPNINDPEKLSEIDFQFYSLMLFHGLLIIPVSVENKVIGLMIFFSIQKKETLKFMQVELINSYLLQLGVIINNTITHEKLMNEIQSVEVEMNRYEKLLNELSKYVSPKIYERVSNSNQQIEISSQYKYLTVFSSDIVGFTDLSEHLEPEEITQMLNYYFNEMTNIAIKYDATVDKYIGDSIQIFFGDPVSNGKEKDALHCCKMAIEMQEKVNELQLVWTQYGITKQLIIRIGIHSGFCSVGNFGSNRHMQYSIFGDTVQIANELQEECTPGHVLVSKSTYSLVKDEFNFRKLKTTATSPYEIVTTALT